MASLRVFSSKDSAYHFAPIKKHKWPGLKISKILAEQCAGIQYTDVQEFTFKNLHAQADFILSESRGHDLFFFIEYNLNEVPGDAISQALAAGYRVFICAYFEPFTVKSFEELNNSLPPGTTAGNCWFISANTRVFDTSKPKDLNVAYFDFFSGYHVYGSREYTQPAVGDPLPKKDFLCLTLRPRPARKYFLDLLKSHNIYDLGYTSEGGTTIEGANLTAEQMTAAANASCPPAFNNLSKWSNSVYFEIVMEDVNFSVPGTHDENFILISEKIYRTILNKLPFIIYGKPDYLKYLRALGFKTYSDLFDESYDDVEDWQLRGRIIAKQVKSFCLKTESEKDILRNRVQEVVDFNYQHLLNDNNLCRLFTERLV